MAPHDFFIIIGVVPSGKPEVAAHYNGADGRLILEPLDEKNENQHWLIESFDKPTTIVSGAAGAGKEQAASDGGFVAAKSADLKDPHLWIIKRIGCTGDVYNIEEVKDGKRTGRVWGGGKAVSSYVTLEPDKTDVSAEQWILKKKQAKS